MQQWVPRIQKSVFITSNINKCMLYNLFNIHSSRNNSTEIDVIDEFSIQLSKEKSEKWRERQQFKMLEQTSGIITYTSPWKFDFKNRVLSALSNPKPLDVDINNLSTEQVDAFIMGAVNSEEFTDVENLTKQCISYQICPSSDVLMLLLSIYSSRGNSKMVESLMELCSIKQNDKYNECFQLKHFIAKTIWIKGDIEKSTDIFVQLYLINSESRNLVRRMIKYLINDTVSHRSEASGVVLTKMMKMFGERFGDWNFLCFLWEYCWLSEWFGDQQLANELFNEYEPLRNILSDKIPPMSTIALREHQEDAILRLLQLLLLNKMMFCYTRVLECLFVYRYKRQDLYGCHEIVRSCVPVNVKLRPDIQTKYLTLLASSGYSIRQPIRTPKPPPESVKFKF